MRKRSRLNASQRSTLQALGLATADLRFDLPRRFHNAVLCLTQSDPHWISWVERNLPGSLPDLDSPLGRQLLALTEARARALVLRRYSYLGHQWIGNLLFRCDWPISDDGCLTPG